MKTRSMVRVMAVLVLMAVASCAVAQKPVVVKPKRHVMRKVLVVTAIVGLVVLAGMAGRFQD